MRRASADRRPIRSERPGIYGHCQCHLVAHRPDARRASSGLSRSGLLRSGPRTDGLREGSSCSNLTVRAGHRRSGRSSPKRISRATSHLAVPAPRRSTPWPTQPSVWTHLTRRIRANAKALDLARAVSGVTYACVDRGHSRRGIEADGSLEQWRDGRASLEVSALEGRVQTLPVVAARAGSHALRERPAADRSTRGAIGRTAALRSRRPSSFEPIAGPVDAGYDQPEPDAVLATFTGDLYDVAVAAAVAATDTGHLDGAADSGWQGSARPARPRDRVARVPSTRPISKSVQVWFRRDRILPPVENLSVRAHLENGLSSCGTLLAVITGRWSPRPGRLPCALVTGDTPAHC